LDILLAKRRMRIFSQLRIELSACIERWSISHNNIFINIHILTPMFCLQLSQINVKKLP